MINEHRKYLKAGESEATQAQAIIAEIDQKVKNLVTEHLSLALSAEERGLTTRIQEREINAFKDEVIAGLRQSNPDVSDTLIDLIHTSAARRIEDLYNAERNSAPRVNVVRNLVSRDRRRRGGIS